jgi:UDP-N-acetylmuramate: L-alanyl-gamma-D-glutamyl-meso-diaminopimelate ligase
MMPISPSDHPLRIHFSGIGGTGMVAAARLAVEAGYEVRGSDNPLYPPTSHMVEALGVPVATGYAAENLDWAPDLVVLGNALSRGNADVEATLDRGLHYVSQAEWMKDAVLRPRKPVVVAGTHGKTTTTALCAYLLERCDFDPGYFIGGQPLDFEHSARLGPEGSPFVIEGDEYDTAFFDKRAKFFHYLPQIAVVTSLEFDHGDIYPSVEAIEQAFRWMLRQIPSGGHLLLCADHPRAMALREHAFCSVSTYGFDNDADYRGEVLGLEDGMYELAVTRQGKEWASFRVPLAGRHNLQNAIAAIAVADLHGAETRQISEALSAFRGVRRRMEAFHRSGEITFIDDFAHHPTAIRETTLAARERWPDAHLTVVFEPRSNTTVTNQFQDDLVEGLRAADAVWLGPLYRPERVPESERLDRATLAAVLTDADVEAVAADDVDAIVAGLQHLDAGLEHLVLITSNGAFGGIYEKIRAAFPES